MRMWQSVVGIALLSAVGAGCQNKMYSENQDLHQQNRELQQQLDEARRQQAVQAPVAVAPAPAVQASRLRRESKSSPIPFPSPPRLSQSPISAALKRPSMSPPAQPPSIFPAMFSLHRARRCCCRKRKNHCPRSFRRLKKDYAGKPVSIEGHTDSDPIQKSGWKSNQELSEKRAEAVRDYLISRGIKADRLTAEGLGDTRPKSKTSKAKNRCVDLVVMTR